MSKSSIYQNYLHSGKIQYMNTLTKKHDPLSRKFLSDISVAKEFLTVHLAPELLAKCDLDTLQIESGSYIEPDLAVHYSDVVYRVELKEDKGTAFIYNLIEHQSSPDKLMPYRILRYQLAIIQKYLEDNEGTELLPVVAALVFYNGSTSPYPYYLDIADLFADKDIYCNAPLGKFKLVDLTIIDDNELLQHKKLALLEILLKHINDRNFAEIIGIIVQALKVGLSAGIGESLLDGAFSYLMNAKETEEFRQLLNQIDKDIPNLKENVMTYAEELRREGEQRGEQRGEQKAQLEIAKNLLKSGVDRSIVAEATHLTLEQINKLN